MFCTKKNIDAKLLCKCVLKFKIIKEEKMTNRFDKLFDVSKLHETKKAFEEVFNNLSEKGESVRSNFIAKFATSVEIREHKDYYKILFLIPMISKENLSLELIGRKLIIEAERKQILENGESVLSSSVVYSKFKEEFLIPDEIILKKENISSTYNDGILIINIQKELKDNEKSEKIIIL